MGRDTPVYNEKNILEVPLELLKSQQNVILLSDWTSFFPSPEKVDKSVISTQCC